VRVQMRVEIKRLQRALGVTSIYVTHDQVEAMTLSDKLVVMNAGQIEQVGTPSDVYRRPQTRYVATFIGSPPMNILPGTVEGPGRVTVGGQSLPVTDMRADVPVGTAVDVGLRPEDLRAGLEGAGMLTADIDFVEELGATQLFHGKLGGAEFVVQAPTGQIPAESKRLSLSIEPTNVHLFDPQTQRRLGS
jgi:sn-glycerol 3-phosphate transport system ATP-binding protein